MNKDLTYLNKDGNQVFTSAFLKQRKTCCKTGCLHCPYGFTIKKYGLKFNDIDETNIHIAQSILDLANEDQDLNQISPDSVKLVTLKDQVCGLIFKNHIVVKKLILLPEFQDQGISKDLVESYYFI